MKAFFIVLLSLAVSGLLLGACGEDESDCDKADNIRAAAFNETCANKGSDCCICKCWNDGEQVVDDPQTCTCKPPASFDCAGDVKAAAKTCLDDLETCRQNVKDVIETECPS